jgi:hypothetical protein
MYIISNKGRNAGQNQGIAVFLRKGGRREKRREKRRREGGTIDWGRVDRKGSCFRSMVRMKKESNA